MTQRHVDLVWTLDLTPNLKLTLLALARSADEDGICQQHLAETSLHQTGYSFNQIGRLLTRLRELGYVRVDVRPGDDTSWRFRIAVEGGAA